MSEKMTDRDKYAIISGLESLEATMLKVPGVADSYVEHVRQVMELVRVNDLYLVPSADADSQHSDDGAPDAA